MTEELNTPPAPDDIPDSTDLNIPAPPQATALPLPENVVRLEASDIPACRALLFARTEYFGLELDHNRLDLELQKRFSDPAWQFYGYMQQDGSLSAMCGQRFTEVAPTWLFSWLAIAPVENGISFENSGYLDVMKAAIMTAEAANRFCFYGAITADQFPARAKRVYRLTRDMDHPLNNYGLNVWWEGKLTSATPQQVQLMLWDLDIQRDYKILQYVRLVDRTDW